MKTSTKLIIAWICVVLICLINWNSDRDGFEMLKENSMSTLIVIGVILLVLGLLMLAIKKSDFWGNTQQGASQKDIGLSTISAERRANAMQPGLREDRKISEYERKKLTVNTIMVALGAADVSLIFIMILSALKGRATITSVLISLFYPITILISALVALFIANAVICAIFDHVIEMCYANQYKTMHYSQNSVGVVGTKPTTHEGMDD